MTPRPIRQVIPALALAEGAGVHVRRTIGTPPLRHLDPFLMLDHFSSENPDEYIAGFPDHPHRGFITLTYMIDGHMLHQDSMGNRGDLRSGGIQWMKTGSGVIHSEMPQQSQGLMRGFQLWINLPAAEKMSDPEYWDCPADRVPVVEDADARVKVIGGVYGGRSGPVDDPHTGLQYLDISLAEGRPFALPLDEGLSAFVYLFEGALRIGDTGVGVHHLVLFGPGGPVEVRGGEQGARLILVAGRPLNEPVVQYGPFVMNTQQEIRQAFDDYQNGRLVKKKAHNLSP